MEVDQLAVELQQAYQQYGLEGITLLGGEPFAQASAAAAIARAAWDMGLTVLVFSGYTLEQLQAMAEPAVQELLRYTDMLVDGPYDRNQPETRRRWIGSANQRLYFLSGRCQWDDRWLQRNTLEIRVRGNEVIINGFPAPRAAGLWKGWRRLRAKTTPKGE